MHSNNPRSRALSSIADQKYSVNASPGSSATSAASAVAELLETLFDDRADQRILGREAAEDRRVPDAGATSDLVDADVRPALGECFRRRFEHAGQVALRVGAKSGHAATGTACSC